MRPLTKLAAFAVVLAASFGIGAAVGAALPDLGPSSDQPTPPTGQPQGGPADEPPGGPTDQAPAGGHQP